MSALTQLTSVHQERPAGLDPEDIGVQPIMICLFGNLRLLKDGHAVALREGGKTASLLLHLALRYRDAVPRDTLLEALWPGAGAALAGQSLNSLVYSLHKSLCDAIGGASPVVYSDGSYRLNREQGVSVDVALFDSYVQAGDKALREGRAAAAFTYFSRVVELYRGDLCAGTDVHLVVERERLRAIFLTSLARLASAHFRVGEYASCVVYASQVLAHDPCREDAHRLLMRCHVRQGERAQALRQYRLCERILRHEFDASPELATTQLFDLIRHDPGGV